MKKDWLKQFIKMVKIGAPMKAFEKKLGLSKKELDFHLKHLAEYEALVASEPEDISVKKKKTKKDK